MLTELNLYPVIGLYEELYRPDLTSMSIDPLSCNGRWSLRRANSLFWAQHLNYSSLASLVERLNKRFIYTKSNTPQYEAVLGNPDLFIEKVITAPAMIANQAIDQESFFSLVELLTITCNLYSELIYNPFRLTIEEGFLVDDSSSKNLVENCLNPRNNPYYDFIVENCLPVIESIKPNLIWILGPIRFSTFTMAMLARELFKYDLHISVIGHSSEYYSLNKIIKYLKNNELLFSVIDSIILDDAENTQYNLSACIDKNISIENVNNILYIDRKNNKIKDTAFRQSEKKVSNWIDFRNNSFFQKNNKKVIDPSELVNIKLWPNAKCYWNRCTFCGINQKYRTIPEENLFEDVDSKIKIISELANQGCRYFWLIDEAVPPATLEKLAHGLLKQGLKLHWQARSRIDENFSQQLCDILAKSGLKEIRLGLESANYRILNLMDKFPEKFNIITVEKLVKIFHESGISVHFPCIVGFPTETMQERYETFDFLYSLKSKYPSMTFNINAFGLDVSSKIFKKYEEFGITTIKWPCLSKYFLGNIIDWDSTEEPFKKNYIDSQRDSFMRKVMYPFMPKTAMTPSYILYRLSETSRITLIWKSSITIDKERNDCLSADSIIHTSPCLSYRKIDRKIGNNLLHRVYDWNSHNFLECDNIGIKILSIFKEPKTVQDGLEILREYLSCEKINDDKERIINDYMPQLKLALKYHLINRYPFETKN